MSIWAKENIKSKREILKSILEPLVSKGDVKLDISWDSKIYIRVKRAVKDKFILDFSPFLEIEEETAYENNDDEWFYFDYLALYDAIPCDDVNLVALAYAIQDLNFGNVPVDFDERLECECMMDDDGW